MIAFLFDCAFKSTLVLLVAFAMNAILRHRSAALRHSVWSAALLTVAILPALIFLVPGAQSEMNLSTMTRMSVPMELSPAAGVSSAADTNAGAEESITSSPYENTALGVWTFGSLLVVLIFLAEALHLARIAYASRPFFNSRWFRMAQDLSRRLALKRPVRFVQNRSSSMLVTWGAFQPRVLLPCGADEWSDHRISAVLGHELAHVCRHDWFFQLVGEIARSMYWFNPLVWFACNRLRQESERACDDAALGLGMDSTEYAAEVLNLARLLKSSYCSWASSLAMARPSTLERRFAAMLNPRLDRRSLGRKGALAVVVGALFVTLSVAAMQSPVQNKTGRLFGRVYDPGGAPIKNATVTIYNTASKFKAVSTSNESGMFEFLLVAPGEYELQTSAAGFQPFQIHSVVIEANQEVNLNVMTVAAPAPGAPVKAAAVPAAQKKPAPQPSTLKPARVAETLAPPPPAQQEAEAPKSEEPAPPHRIRQGGNVVAGNLISQVRPVYPQEAREARIAGVVVLEVLIGTDGTVQSAKVVTGHPLLQQSAIDSVSQWHYKPVLLNGVPVEVLTTVTVNYSLE